MAGSAVVGGLILALIEGMGILFTRMTAEQFRPVGPTMEDATPNGTPPFGTQQYQ